MKKALILLLLAGMIVPVFADDALVLPQGVMRFRTIPALSLTSQQFDNDGEKQDLSGNVDTAQVWALNFALEFGVTEQINLAAQWTPGWQFASTVSASGDVPSAQADIIENAQQTGLNDLFVGAKAQIIGPNGYVPNENMRFAASVGALVPLSVYDAQEAADNYNANLTGGDEEYRAGRAGRDVWALGARLHFDYILSEMFYVNLFSETQFFVPRDLENASFGNTGASVSEAEYGYGYQQAFEIDPQFSMPLSSTVSLSGSLATRYTMTPDFEVGGNPIDDSASQILTITPQVGAFFRGLPVPVETKLQYSVPVYGVNRAATNSLALQINTYLAF